MIANNNQQEPKHIQDIDTKELREIRLSMSMSIDRLKRAFERVNKLIDITIDELESIDVVAQTKTWGECIFVYGICIIISGVLLFTIYRVF